MEQDFKREARKQYFKYFRIWFIVLGCLLIIGMVVSVSKMMKSANSAVRGNNEAPTERVYDLADVLTDEEETSLREYIAKCEAKAHVDIVLVTGCVDVEGNHESWEIGMRDSADDFYDSCKYGYDEVHGDGVLLLDNWCEGQEGSWLSTCGSVYERFGDYEINRILDEVYYEVEDDPYNAYKTYVTMVTNYMVNDTEPVQLPWLWVIATPIVVALIFAFSNLSQKAAADTTTATTYIAGGKPVMNVNRDEFLRKSVTSRRIETNSGSSGGRSSGGRGGSHRSSSGVSHGGGGRRR